MNEPKYILESGTKILTHEALDASKTRGMFVKPESLAARKPGLQGVIAGIVGGHGGDVYWVKHEDGSVAVYGWWEFEELKEEKKS